MPCNYDKKRGAIVASGEVGDWMEGFTKDEFKAALAEAGGADVVVELDSMGGDVFQGQSIYNALKDYTGRSRVVIDSISASIATILMCGADETVAHQNSTVMVHNPYTIAIGDAKAFRHTADVLDKLTMDSAEIYAEKSGRTVGYWLDKMDSETWMGAEEAIAEGLVDGIVGAKQSGPRDVPRAAAASVAQVAVSASVNRAKAKAKFRRVVLRSLGIAR